MSKLITKIFSSKLFPFMFNEPFYSGLCCFISDVQLSHQHSSVYQTPPTAPLNKFICAKGYFTLLVLAPTHMQPQVTVPWYQRGLIDIYWAGIYNNNSTFHGVVLPSDCRNNKTPQVATIHRPQSMVTIRKVMQQTCKEHRSYRMSNLHQSDLAHILLFKANESSSYRESTASLSNAFHNVRLS